MKLNTQTLIANLAGLAFHLSIVLAFFGGIGQLIAIFIGSAEAFAPIAFYSVLAALGLLLASIFTVMVFIEN